MIVETALTLAGPDAVLAARPTGVAHVYTGPLTPSGRYIPRAGRSVCRARTRRLAVVTIPVPWSSLSHPGALPRLCARCSACLARRRHTTPRTSGAAVSHVRQAEHTPPTRAAYRSAFSDLTLFDLWLAGMTADTTTELDTVGHLALLLFGYQAGAAQPVTRPDGQQVTSLHQVLTLRRNELDPNTDTLAAADTARESVAAIRRERGAEIREHHERQRPARRAITRSGAPL